jgi:divalent metal cation (Fe/Co/Zn/Cd) transporter
VPGVRHAHARARWTGRTLRLEVEGWLDAGTSVAEADAVGREVARAVGQELPDVRSFSWTARPA